EAEGHAIAHADPGIIFTGKENLALIDNKEILGGLFGGVEGCVLGDALGATGIRNIAEYGQIQIAKEGNSAQSPDLFHRRNLLAHTRVAIEQAIECAGLYFDQAAAFDSAGARAIALGVEHVIVTDPLA